MSGEQIAEARQV